MSDRSGYDMIVAASRYETEPSAKAVLCWLATNPPKSRKPLVSKSVLELLDELQNEHLTRKGTHVK